jgi:hypothetical protein
VIVSFIDHSESIDNKQGLFVRKRSRPSVTFDLLPLLPLFSSPVRRFARLRTFAQAIVSRYRTAAARAPPSHVVDFLHNIQSITVQVSTLLPTSGTRRPSPRSPSAASALAPSVTVTPPFHVQFLSPSFPFCFLPFVRSRRLAPSRLMCCRFHFIHCTCIPAPRSAPSVAICFPLSRTRFLSAISCTAV